MEEDVNSPLDDAALLRRMEELEKAEEEEEAGQVRAAGSGVKVQTANMFFAGQGGKT